MQHSSKSLALDFSVDRFYGRAPFPTFVCLAAPCSSGSGGAMVFLQCGLSTSIHLCLFHRIKTRVSVSLYLLMSD